MRPDSSISNSIICVVGPTASGKSELAQLIAERVDGEIISADSMQIYKGMDIGTGKVLPSEQRVSHYGLDLVQPGDPYSAALFQKYARSMISSISSRNKRVIMCGGTGFYVRAALDDYQFPVGEQDHNPIRDFYRDMETRLGSQAVWDELKRLDPASAEVIHPNNVKRVIRALEMYNQGISYADQIQKLKKIKPFYHVVYLGLSVEPEILNQRINERVDAMVENGLLQEVLTLLDNGFRSGITAPQAIGYKEIVSCLDGEISFEEAVDMIKQASRRYAKRQRSWFRQDKRIHWLDANENNAERLCELALGVITSSEH